MAIIIAVLGGCTAADAEPSATACETAVNDAAEAIEVDAQKRALSRALAECSSATELERQLQRHPGLIGYSPEGFIAVNCEKSTDRETRRGPICQRGATTTTTSPATTTIADPEYVGDTLDGRRIQIRPSEDVPFEGNIPAVIQQTVDIAFESGCEGLLRQRDEWYARIDDPRIGDEASVYTRHAQNVADYIDCDLPPLPASPPFANS